MDAHVRFIENAGGPGAASNKVAPLIPPSLNKLPQGSLMLQASPQQAQQGPLTPKGFNRGVPYFKFVRPSFFEPEVEGGFKYVIGPNRLKIPFNTNSHSGLWFCTKRQLPIVGMKYKNVPGILVVEVRLYESSNVIESGGIYKTDILHISNPKPILEFFRNLEVAVWEINPEFVLAFLPLMPNIRRFLIQKNPLNILEFPSYTFEEALEACRRDRELVDDICPEYKLQVMLMLKKGVVKN